jgi:hypothetical protein
MRGNPESPEDLVRVRRYFKNLGRVIALYDKFTR